MRHKNVGNTQCPIARSLQRVGEWWSILILREALRGSTRFDQFQTSLSIAPNMLTRRLNSLVESGLLARRQYSRRPPRDEYVLTDSGRDFEPVICTLLAWGNKHFAPEGLSVIVVNAATGELAEPIVVDGKTGQRIQKPAFRYAAGPAAKEPIRRRYAERGLS